MPTSLTTSEEIVRHALVNERVRALHEEINAGTALRFLYEDHGSWGSKTVNGCTEITTTPTNWPDAALAHELLHAKLKLRGYRQYLTVCSMDEHQHVLMKVVHALDNELQHHRIFQDFVALGLSPERFYHDDDVDAFQSVRLELKQMSPRNHPGAFLLKYLTLIAPGGMGDDDARRKVKSVLRSQSGQATWQVMQNVEKQISFWRDASVLDAGQTIKEILNLLGFSRTWFGVSAENFPDHGHFVQSSFTAEEAVAWHEARKQRNPSD